FVDVEGLVLHVVWEKEAGKARWALRNWYELLEKAKAPQIESGILLLAAQLFIRIANKAGIDHTEVIDYVTGNSAGWDFDASRSNEIGTSTTEGDRDVASLDAAILALLGGETADSDIETERDAVREGSLFSRQLAREEAALQEQVRAFGATRARQTWATTTAPQRKGYHAAGVGL